MTPRLVWLASYPKSGNTWVRALLQAYLFGVQDPQQDLRMDGLGGMYSSRMLFDSVTGIPSAFLSTTEIDSLRADVWRLTAERARRPIFVKTHDMWGRGAEGEVLFPSESTAATIVIVRNPLAVAPSWAHHSGQDLDDTIAGMADHDAVMANSRYEHSGQLPQRLGSWSDHVTSWLNQEELTVTLVRYEDLSADTPGQLTRMLEAVGLVPDHARVHDAVAACAFEVLQQRESQAGFGERPRPGLTFFRQGQVDGWRSELSPAQVASIVADHAPAMQRLGYTPPIEGKPHEAHSRRAE